MEKQPIPCLFCSIVQGSSPAVTVARNEHCMAILDIQPITSGHLLVIPAEHAQHMHQLSPESQENLFRFCIQLMAALYRSGLNCQGVNMLLNDGRAANQHIPHVHMHLIPRYQGDLLKFVFRILLKFVPTTAGRKRYSELENIGAVIKAALEKDYR